MRGKWLYKGERCTDLLGDVLVDFEWLGRAIACDFDGGDSAYRELYGVAG